MAPHIGQTGIDWKAMADIYKKLTVGVSSKSISFMLERLNELYPFSQATGIHDNGSGPGLIISRVIEEYGGSIKASCSLSASDFSGPMIEKVKETQAEKVTADPDSPWKRVKASVLDATDLSSIPDDSFSHMTAGWVYFMTADPMKCLTESRRVLKQTGVLACSSWKESQWMELMHDVTKVRPDKEMPGIPEEWKSAGGVKREMEKAGFVDVEAHDVGVEMTFDSYEALVDMMMNTMPHMIKLMEDYSAEDRSKVKETMTKHAKEMAPHEPGTLRGTSIVAFGRK